MSKESVEQITAKKKNIRRGHQFHLRNLISSVNHLLQDTDSAETNADLISRKLKLERKSLVVWKLD